MNRQRFNKILHIAIWVLVLAVPTIVFWNQPPGRLSLSFFFLSSLYHIAFFYFNAYFLYPRLLTKKRWPLYILSIAAILVFSYHVKVFLLELNPGFRLTWEEKRIVIFSIAPFLFASILFRLISDRLRFERLEKEARTEQLATELKFLRSQVSPHFLFNMLTNMVSLARQRSDLLEPSLIRLSELLRYMLYDSDKDRISINSEIETLQGYIALQQLRFGEDTELKIQIDNSSPGCFIEPMLLIPFIENAFKHGIGLLDKPYIHIQLAVRENKLDFSVINNYNSTNHSKDKASGIGLVNVQNRLQLLYPGKHWLEIKDQKGIFFVHLKLDLS